MRMAQIDQSYELKDERMWSIPDDFVKSFGGIDTTAPEIDVESSLSYRSAGIPVWQFQAHGKILCTKRPVVVSIRKEEDLYYAENENLRIFVAGKSPDEAADAFAEQLIHFYDHYKSLSPSSVTGKAQKLKQLYHKFFEESDA